MSYSSFETSIEGSRPIELYLFVLGSETFAYTSAEDEITVGDVTYQPESIQRGRIAQNPEERQNALEIEVPSRNTFARRYVGIVPSQPAEATVTRIQRDDGPTPETRLIFQGRVSSVAFVKSGLGALISIVPAEASKSRTIPRHTYQALCNHVLYDVRCKVDPDNPAFRLQDAEVLAVDGLTIDVAGADDYPDGWFTSGFVEARGGIDLRLILEHTGTTLRLLLPFPGDVLGEEVDVLAGCDHSMTACRTKFFTTEDPDSNIINFGGFGYVPTANIFATGLD